MADPTLSMDDGVSGIGPGIPIDDSDSESTWLELVNSGLSCRDGSVVEKSGGVIGEGFGKSVKVMSKDSRGYEEAGNSQADISGSKSWFEFAKLTTPEEDCRLELGVSAASLRCSERSEVEATEDAAYTHGVPRLAQRVQMGWV